MLKITESLFFIIKKKSRHAKNQLIDCNHYVIVFKINWLKNHKFKKQQKDKKQANFHTLESNGNLFPSSFD